MTDDWRLETASDLQAEYRAAYQGAVLLDRSHEGRLLAAGRDWLSLLHRMSTNDLEGLAEGVARPTVLTTAVARMVDLIWVLPQGESGLLITGPGQAAKVRRWLASYTFFNDDAQFVDASDELSQLGVYGPGAAQVVESVALGASGLSATGQDAPSTQGEKQFLESGELIVLRARPLAGDGFALIGPAASMPQTREKLIKAGAVPAGEETFHVLRIEAGQPYVEHEIGDEYIPLEAGLWQAVSFSKGCYIGQEIIARMESRGKLAKTLVGLKLSAPVMTGAEVRYGERKVGQVSSAAVSPGTGPIALAFVKPEFATPGTGVRAGEAEGEVVRLPMTGK